MKENVYMVLSAFFYSLQNFDVKILEQLGAIPQLLEYYTVFNNFAIQSDIKRKSIYGEELNSRDAWSKLIINYANNNVSFVKSCLDGSKRFELNAGLSVDRQTGNFFQLIKN